jgi:hypothetical protein
MGKEQLDRTKRFTDDGKLTGIIQSAKFVPEYPEEVKYDGFGGLFRVQGRKDEEVERELDIVDEDQIVKKRKTENRGTVAQFSDGHIEIRDPAPRGTKRVQRRTDEDEEQELDIVGVDEPVAKKKKPETRGKTIRFSDDLAQIQDPSPRGIQLAKGRRSNIVTLNVPKPVMEQSNIITLKIPKQVMDAFNANNNLKKRRRVQFAE